MVELLDDTLIGPDDKVYRTWHTDGRATEQLSYTFALVDILPWGRQEEWQDSPEGWPKSPAYSNWLDSPTSPGSTARTETRSKRIERQERLTIFPVKA
jgi:Bacterial protein of unknown function (DUF899)